MKKDLLDKMSGKELRELIDNEVITVEELSIAALEKVFDYEIDMLCLGKGDMELIHKCSELIDAANGGSISSEDEFRAIINKARAEYVTIVPDKRIRKPFVFKRALIIAAAVIVVAASSVMIAGAFGFDIVKYIKDTVFTENGSVTEADGFTFHNIGYRQAYSSIEELISNEGYNILYPTKLPEDVGVSNIARNKSERNTDLIHIFTTDKNVYILIELNAHDVTFDKENFEVYQHNNVEYYITAQENSYFALCYYNGNYYSIQANNRDELIMIVDNLKE